MLTQRVEKLLVCSECGRPLASHPVPAALVERAVQDDDAADEGIIDALPEQPVEYVVEEGPVCSRCAEFR